MPTERPPGRRPAALGRLRATLAGAAGRGTAQVVRRVRGRGGNTVGGRVALALDPALLTSLLGDREVLVVTGTNGKTTTTGLLAAAVGLDRPIVSNRDGSNLPRGVVSALLAERAGAPSGPPATGVFEVDELYVPAVLRATPRATVVLLNLSRDQLDRTAEVFSVATRWRAGFAAARPVRVIANADDPNVVAAVGPGVAVTWVAAGLAWRNDSVACGACAAQIRFGDDGWACEGCDRRRPAPDWRVDATALVGPDGTRTELHLVLPGRHNRANAAMAAVAAVSVGVPLATVTAAFAGVDAVAGRAAHLWGPGHDGRLFLAKNPAGFAEVLELLDQRKRPVLVCINAHGVDGRDTSWLYDVPFERLAGARVLAGGERGTDLAVRLRYAGVDHERVVDLDEALARARALDADVVCTYSAFRSVLAKTGVAGA